MVSNEKNLNLRWVGPLFILSVIILSSVEWVRTADVALSSLHVATFQRVLVRSTVALVFSVSGYLAHLRSDAIFCDAAPTVMVSRLVRRWLWIAAPVFLLLLTEVCVRTTPTHLFSSPSLKSISAAGLLIFGWTPGGFDAVSHSLGQVDLSPGWINSVISLSFLVYLPLRLGIKTLRQRSLGIAGIVITFAAAAVCSVYWNHLTANDSRALPFHESPYMCVIDFLMGALVAEYSKFHAVLPNNRGPWKDILMLAVIANLGNLSQGDPTIGYMLAGAGLHLSISVVVMSLAVLISAPFPQLSWRRGAGMASVLWAWHSPWWHTYSGGAEKLELGASIARFIAVAGFVGLTGTGFSRWLDRLFESEESA